jgi:DNA-binding transcriptional LysR family regulator
MENLDIAVLRTLIAIDQKGSFARAAKYIGRSESAISLQLRRLEGQVGSPLFHRVGRRMELTDAGQTMLAYARQIVEINDKALTVTNGRAAEAVLRIGVPSDLAETWLPPVLARFGRTYSQVRVDAIIGRSPALLAQFNRNELDIAVTFVSGEPPQRARWTTPVPMVWIGRRGFHRKIGDPVRLAVFDPPCLFRAAATNALDASGIEWTVSFTSPSLAGLWGALAAGLGITVRTPQGLPPQLTPLHTDAGLPALPNVGLALFDRGEPSSPASTMLVEVLIETLEMAVDAAI